MLYEKEKITIFIVLLTYFILITLNLSAQLSNRDSSIIEKYKAIRLTDSINSLVPASIRIITLEYLKKIKLNPEEYYILDTFHPKIFRDRTYGEVGILNLFRIGALRDLSDGSPDVGGAGEEGDDIQIIYDKDYKRVLKIINSE